MSNKKYIYLYTNTRAVDWNFAAGGWCAADDGDEEIIELRSNDGGARDRGHLAQASPSASSATIAAAATATADHLPQHSHAHSSHTLPLALPQSQSFAQTSAAAATAEAETSLFRHRLGSRYIYIYTYIYPHPSCRLCLILKAFLSARSEKTLAAAEQRFSRRSREEMPIWGCMQLQSCRIRAFLAEGMAFFFLSIFFFFLIGISAAYMLLYNIVLRVWRAEKESWKFLYMNDSAGKFWNLLKVRK